MPLAAGSQFNLQSILVGSIAEAAGIGSSSQALNIQSLAQFLGGNGLGQIDEFYEATLGLAPSGTTTLALTGGGLTDPFGGVIAMLHAKFVLIQVQAFVAPNVAAGALILAPGAVNPANLMLGGTTPTLTIGAGETFLQTFGNGSVPNAGWPIVAATGMNIKFTNASGAQSCFASVIIGGTST